MVLCADVRGLHTRLSRPRVAGAPRICTSDRLVLCGDDLSPPVISSTPRPGVVPDENCLVELTGVI